jgi:hypothetical protein
MTATSPGGELLERLAALEQELQRLRNRVELLERRRDGAPATPARIERPPESPAAPGPPEPKPRELPSIPPPDLGRRIEELVGGRLLAVVGARRSS